MSSNDIFPVECNERGPWVVIHRVPTAEGDLVYEANPKGECRLWLDVAREATVYVIDPTEVAANEYGSKKDRTSCEACGRAVMPGYGSFIFEGRCENCLSEEQRARLGAIWQGERQNASSK